MTLIDKCRGCKSGKSLELVLDLGNQSLSDFRIDDSKPKQYPLCLLICESCGLAQLSYSVDRAEMYHDGYGYRSGVNEIIRNNLKQLVDLGASRRPRANSWLDIACNDGTLLSFVDSTLERVGVDPVKKFAPESSLHASKIISDFFSARLLAGHSFDVVTSVSMFYDLDDPAEFAAEVEQVLAPDGVWIIQQNYLGSMYRNNSFDNICHEHLTYFSLSALESVLNSVGLCVTYVEENSMNGGSIVTVVERLGAKVHESVDKLLKTEAEALLNKKAGAEKFADGVATNIRDLRTFLQKAKVAGSSVMVYGASTRGAVIWQALGDEFSVVECAVERQSEKVGKYYSALGIRIISESEMRLRNPDYLLVGPWFLKDGFVARESAYLQHGGKLVFPLPHLHIVEA